MSETRSRPALDQELASFVSELAFTDLPEATIRTAERAFVDTVGVTVAGAMEGAGRRAVQTTAGDGGPCTVLGTDGSASPTDAAFANATAGHGLDFDDVTRGVWHPSVPMVAPILAVAEEREASGAAAITAYVAGFETQSYLADALLPGHYERGWHATATLGTFGATAATAVLLDLDRIATQHALNAAASMPAGLKRNFGTMTKPMHAGQAARSGVTAGLLAEEEFTAARGAVGDKRGFCELYSGPAGPSFDRLPTLGDQWALSADGIQVKKYPCCYFTHPAIAGVRRLVADHGLAVEDVDRVEVIASQGAADALHYTDPDTGLEAKFSMEYVVACAIARDRVDLAAFDDENVHDPTVQRLRERVTFRVDSELSYDPYRATVSIETDGETVQRLQERPPGTPAAPLSDEELAEKFHMCLDRADRPLAATAAYECLDQLRDADLAADALAHLH